MLNLHHTVIKSTFPEKNKCLIYYINIKKNLHDMSHMSKATSYFRSWGLTREGILCKYRGKSYSPVLSKTTTSPEVSESFYSPRRESEFTPIRKNSSFQLD